MKTIIDAVNHFKGEWKWPHHSSLSVFIDGSWHVNLAEDDGVFTKSEFLNMVAELSKWQPTLKGCDVETVTVDGMVYEIGKSYITNTGEIAVLHSAASPTGFIVKYPDGGKVSSFLCNGLSTNPEWTTGTITKAPITLTVGQLYLFDNGSRMGIVGRHYVSAFDKPMFDFVNSGHFIEVAKCTNVIQLVPMEK